MSHLKQWQDRALGLHDKKENAKERWEAANPDIDEASDRCGMDSRHSLSGVVLVETATGDEWGILYHWFCAPVKFISTRGILFQFECEEGLFNVEITGDGSEASIDKLRMISRQLCWSKRAVLHSNGSVVKAVTITKVEEEEEESP